MPTSEITHNPRRLTSSVPGVPAAEPPGFRHPAPPGPDLSEREIEVLSYLPTMLTVGEIAGELYISVNTVKAHMRSIYCKLGASRRREAVDQAYERGILQTPQRLKS